jgi:hypothetical protein
MRRLPILQAAFMVNTPPCRSRIFAFYSPPVLPLKRKGESRITQSPLVLNDLANREVKIIG